MKTWRTVLLVCVMISLLAAATVTLAVPVGQPAASLTPSGLINPMFITASHIVSQATIEMMFQGTLTAQASLVQQDAEAVIDPMFITATYIVGQATAGALEPMTATATPVPLSDVERDYFVQGWVDDLESAAGFSHPVFGHIAYELLRFGDAGSIREQYHLDPKVVRIEFRGRAYVGIYVNPILTLLGEQFLLFSVLGDEVTLLFHRSHSVVRMNAGEFGDVNSNGLPDLQINLDSRGSCPVTSVHLLEIQPEGEVIDLVPQVTNETRRQALTDLNKDGLPEIEMFWREDIPLPGYGGFCHDLGVTRYYGWDGEAYHDITATFEQSYFPSINAYFDSIEDEACVFPDIAMYQMLFDYLSLGRLVEGWARLESHLAWSACSADELIQHGREIGNILMWVGEKLQDQGYE